MYTHIKETNHSFNTKDVVIPDGQRRQVVRQRGQVSNLGECVEEPKLKHDLKGG